MSLCLDASNTTLPAVDFSGSILNFRFIDIDVSVTINLESGDFLFIPGFNNTDSVSRINIPRDLLNNLFLYTLTYTDLSNNVWSNMRYAMNVWPDISFSNSKVILSKAIQANARNQHLQYDYIRYLLRTITGTNFLSGLFRNKDELLQKVVSLDSNFNTSVREILSTCGTQLAPMDNTSYYNNPGRILIESILAQDNVLETDNVERRALLIQNFKDRTNALYTANKNTPYYVLGLRTPVTTTKFYYPIYLDVSTNRTTPVKFISASFFGETVDLSGYTFYTTNNTTLSMSDSSGSISSNIINYATIHNYFFPFNFAYSDSLSVRVTYKPKNNTYLGKEIPDRSYEVYLDVGLDTSFNVLYDASGSEGLPALVIAGNPRQYQPNLINKAFQYVFFNVSPPNLYYSPYNFYPTLFDIQEITFSTMVEKRFPSPNGVITVDNIIFDCDEWNELLEMNHDIQYCYVNTSTDIPYITDELQAQYDLSNNMSTVNWFVSVFTRPRNKVTDDSEGIGFDRYNSIPIVSRFDTWETFNLSNLKWDNNMNCQCPWTEILKLPVISVTPYGSITLNGDQQIMAIAIATDNINFRGYSKDVVITFNDGRYIKMV
jgi:hypothetical protein